MLTRLSLWIRRLKLASGTRKFRFVRTAKFTIHLSPSKAIYDSVFPNNPKAIRSLNMEDWDMFCSPWAQDRSDEEVNRSQICAGSLVHSSSSEVSQYSDSMRRAHRQGPASLLYLWYKRQGDLPTPVCPHLHTTTTTNPSSPGLLIIVTPGAEAAAWIWEDSGLSLLRRGVRRLLYRLHSASSCLLLPVQVPAQCQWWWWSQGGGLYHPEAGPGLSQCPSHSPATSPMSKTDHTLTLASADP